MPSKDLSRNHAGGIWWIPTASFHHDQPMLIKKSQLDGRINHQITNTEPFFPTQFPCSEVQLLWRSLLNGLGSFKVCITGGVLSSPFHGRHLVDSMLQVFPFPGRDNRSMDHGRLTVRSAEGFIHELVGLSANTWSPVSSAMIN